MAEKKKRLSTLQAALNAFHQEQSKDMVGGIEKCLVTGVAKKSPDQLQARTECNRVVNFDFNELVKIKINNSVAFCSCLELIWTFFSNTCH